MTNAEPSYFWGLVVPGTIILISFLATLWLYHRFSRQQPPD
jgi:hypothetical protein